MLKDHVERYLELRAVLGFKLRDTRRQLRAFANFAAQNGDKFIRTTTAAAWADQAPSSYARSCRMQRLVMFAKFLKAEDPNHEVPSLSNYQHRYVRPTPYIYKTDEVARILKAFDSFKKTDSTRKKMYQTIIGLIASTGLRSSEALNLRFSDIDSDGVIHVRETKFGKSRLVPMHETTKTAIDDYLLMRGSLKLEHDYLFFSRRGQQLSLKTLDHNFREAVKMAKIAPNRQRKPRIHDLRHTFATRALQNCPTDRNKVEKHFIATSTYLGHVDVQATYWYLEAAPELMQALANEAEGFFGGAQ
jgi:integrase/recombinase XerD